MNTSSPRAYRLMNWLLAICVAIGVAWLVSVKARARLSPAPHPVVLDQQQPRQQAIQDTGRLAGGNVHVNGKTAENEARIERDMEAAYNSARDAVDSVKLTLRDPQSAIFKDVWAVRATYAGATGTFACGSLNSKNGFGGYSGFQPFVAIGHTVILPDEPIFAGVFKEVCLNGEKVIELRL